MEATPGFEPGNEGFADPCLTTWLCRHVRGQSTILFPHKHMRTSSPVFSQGPGQRQLLSKIKGAYLAPIKNGAGDGARTRFPVSRERRSAIRRSPPGPPIPRAFGPGWRQRVHGSRWPHPRGGSLLPQKNGAGDGARTRYLHLGKVALYQMSYARRTLWIIAKSRRFVNGKSKIFRAFSPAGGPRGDTRGPTRAQGSNSTSTSSAASWSG